MSGWRGYRGASHALRLPQAGPTDS
jgi:hypothetical protein